MLVLKSKSDAHWEAVVAAGKLKACVGTGQQHTPNFAFRHLPPNSARTGCAIEGLRGTLLSSCSCPLTLSAPPKGFRY